MRLRALRAQVAAETRMTLERGETLLVTLGIPVVLLVFFTVVPVLPTGTRHRVDFLAPGVLALAVMSTAMVALGIATAFERSYGVLRRLGCDPARPAGSARREDRLGAGRRDHPGRRARRACRSPSDGARTPPPVSRLWP